MAKQQKKSKLTVIPPQPDFQEQEIELLQEDLNDDLIKTLSKANTNSIATIKEKEKKVVEFKSRVLELVEIFVSNTKNPSIFIERIYPFIKMISDFKNPQKIQYINRVCKLIHQIIQKGDLGEHVDNMKQCCETLITYIHKCSEKSINKRFFELLDLILKQLSQYDKKIVADIIVKGLVLMRKNSNIQLQNMRKLIFNYQFALIPVILKLCQLSEINENYERSKYNFSHLLFTLIQNEQIRKKISSKDKIKQAIIKLTQHTLENYTQQNFKRVAIFRQILLSYKQLELNELQEQIQSFESEDQNIQHIITKLK
ncbi:unnamed protein product [Paramecium sonneborni]|uniref:Uncharacterized protein n=1 Tax=Paramecium sonneborni TaxID=65129 RepID=A0A8S1PEN4_9CILI|nr:unnamed protein product [Paramecium sonneborni]